MTTGSWNRDSFTYINGVDGAWSGQKWDRSWSGADQGSPPLYSPPGEHVTMFTGFGARNANEIFSALEREKRETEAASAVFAKSGKREAYLARVAQAERARERRLKESYERALLRFAQWEARKAQNKIDKEWRKVHGVPFPKALLTAPPPSGYILTVPVITKVPARLNPRPPKRARNDEHAYSVTETRLQDDLGFVDQCLGDGPRPYAVMNGYCVPNWTTGGMLTANDQIALVGKLREKLQGSDFNMSVFLGESHQALRLIGDTAIRVAKTLWHIKRGQYADATRSLLEGTSRAPLRARAPPSWGRVAADAQTMSARILELQYGFKPLLSDVYAASAFVAHQLNYPATKTYRVSVKKSRIIQRYSFWSEYCNQGMQSLHPVTASAATSHRRGIIAKVSEGDLPSLPYALGLADPEVVLWELVPFSFVWDWFQPIGPYLQARADASRLTGVFVTSDKMLSRAFPPSGLPWSPPRGFYGYSKAVFSREISTTLRVPMPELKSLKQAGSFQHCLNGLALLTSFATGHSRVK